MSDLCRGRPRRRMLCAMVQLHCWMLRTTDSVVMPFLPLATLVANLASGALHLAGQAADSASAKVAPVKHSGKGKTQSDTATLANAFAACLAAASAATPAVPLPGSALAAANIQKGQVKSEKGIPVVSPPAAPTLSAVKGMPAVAKSGSLPMAPMVKVTPPPTPQPSGGIHAAAAPSAGVNRVAVVPPATGSHAPAVPSAGGSHVSTIPSPVGSRAPVMPPAKSITAAASQTRLPSTHAKKATPATKNAPAPPPPPPPIMSHEGKGEVHLGSHTTVESPAPEIAPPDHEQAAMNTSVSSLSDPPAAEPRRMADTSGVASTAAELPAAAQVSLAAPREEVGNLIVPGLPGVNRLPPASRGLYKEPALAASAAVPPNHGASPPQAQTPSSMPAGPIVAANLAAPPGNSAPPQAAAAPMPMPVAEQLTRAFVAQADVVGQQGRTNFHLRLDPPQLGSVQIHLTAADNTVSARIVVAQQGTQQLLQSQAHHLRQGLAEAGLSLGSFDVTRDGGGSGGGRQAPPEPPPSLPPAGSPTRTTTTVVSPPLHRPTAGIDILA